MENFDDIEDVPVFLALEDWEEQIGELSKAQLALIAEHEGLEVPAGVKKGTLLLQVLKALKSDADESLTQIQKESELLLQQASAHKIEKETIELQLRLEKERREAEKERREAEKEKREAERERAQEREKERKREKEREGRV